MTTVTRQRKQREAPPKPPCTYCGKEGPTTKDHVVPKSLFVPPLPLNMITVPACADCQEQKSWGDDDLRDFVNLDWAGENHPHAAKQVERFKRSDDGGHSRVARSVRATGRIERWVTEAGINTLRDMFVADIVDDNRDMLRTLEFMVRGLHVTSRGKRDRSRASLPPDCPVEVRFVNRLKSPGILRRTYSFRQDEFVMGNEVFWYVRATHADAPTVSFVTMLFNDQVCFLGLTGGPYAKLLSKST